MWRVGGRGGGRARGGRARARARGDLARHTSRSAARPPTGLVDEFALAAHLAEVVGDAQKRKDEHAGEAHHLAVVGVHACRRRAAAAPIAGAPAEEEGERAASTPPPMRRRATATTRRRRPLRRHLGRQRLHLLVEVARLAEPLDDALGAEVDHRHRLLERRAGQALTNPPIVDDAAPTAGHRRLRRRRRHRLADDRDPAPTAAAYWSPTSAALALVIRDLQRAAFGAPPPPRPRSCAPARAQPRQRRRRSAGAARAMCDIPPYSADDGPARRPRVVVRASSSTRG